MQTNYCVTQVSVCHCCLFKHHDQNTIGSSWRVPECFDVAWINEELLTQHIHLCHMARPVSFFLQWDKRLAEETIQAVTYQMFDYIVKLRETKINCWIQNGKKKVTIGFSGLQITGRQCGMASASCIFSLSAACHVVITTDKLCSSLESLPLSFFVQ